VTAWILLIRLTSTSQAVGHLSVVSVYCQKLNKCFQQALSPYHLLANSMHSNYRGQSQTEAELNTWIELTSTQYGPIVWHLINLKAQASSCQKYMFSDSVLTKDAGKLVSVRVVDQTDFNQSCSGLHFCYFLASPFDFAICYYYILQDGHHVINILVKGIFFCFTTVLYVVL
jgi:hypothetical protein